MLFIEQLNVLRLSEVFKTQASIKYKGRLDNELSQDDHKLKVAFLSLLPLFLQHHLSY